jgi:hypothetical protein
LRSYFGFRFGLAAKTLPRIKKFEPKWKGPKWIKYQEVYDPFGLHFARNTPTTNRGYRQGFVAVVEDIISAEKISEHLLPAVALQGTSIRPRQAALLARQFSAVLWFLDPDATNKAMKMHKAYGAIFNESKVILSDQDPKDMPLDDLLAVLTDD